MWWFLVVGWLLLLLGEADAAGVAVGVVVELCGGLGAGGLSAGLECWVAL